MLRHSLLLMDLLVLFNLAEEDYLLEDQTNERKYNFQLSDTVAKAKTLKGQLFAKRTFYVTAKVSVDHKLLKNVITAFGGQVRLVFLQWVVFDICL